MSTTVLVTGTSVPGEILQPLVDAGYDLRLEEKTLTEDELHEALRGVVGYLFGGEEDVVRGALTEADQLRVISFLGVGYEAFMDVEAVKEFGIGVTNTPGTLSASVAEFTVGLLIDGVRLVSYQADLYRSGGEHIKTKEMSSMKIGVVGMGSIGSLIARILRRGFECDIAYTATSPKPQLEKELGIRYMDLHELAAWSDALIVMTIANETTRGLIDSSVIEAMPDESVLVNTSKHFVVDSGALLAGLQNRRIATACFDGFYPSDDDNCNELLAFGNDRLIVTPHIGSLTDEARARMGVSAVKNLVDYLSGQHCENIRVPGSR